MTGTARDRRLTPARPDLAAAALRGVVEATRYAEPERMEVSASLVGMRARPAHDSPLDTQLLRGERVDVYEIASGWAWCQAVGDGYVGYLPAAALAPDGPAPTHRVAGLAAHIYGRPGIKTPEPLRLPGFAMVAVAETEGGFARLAAGMVESFIPLAQLASIAAPVPDWVATAERLLGAPYLWGGRSADGLDCSALLQLALGTAGIAAPRDSDMQQASLGETLAPDAALRRGDLVFWRGHVGVMRDGEMLLHANAHHMAVATEPLEVARARIGRSGGGPVTRLKRLHAAPALR